LTVTLNEDDILWGRLHNLNFSEVFGEHLTRIRRETEAAAFALLAPRAASRRVEKQPHPGE
jgi:hypothetical protein